MKTSKKIISYLLTVAMIVSLASAISISAFAASPTKFTVEGADYAIPTGATGISDTDLAAKKLADFKDVATIVVEISDAALKTIDGTNVDLETVIAADDSTALTYLKNPAADTGFLSTIATAAADITSLQVGDVLWVLDTANNANTVARLVIATKSAGQITGDGQKTVVAYNVVVPLNLDFALDPLEIADKSGIAGADYTIINKTKDTPVKVEFKINTAVTSQIPVLADKNSFSSTPNTKEAYMEIVSARSATVTAGAVTALNYDAAGTTDAAKELSLARRTAPFPAVAATTKGGDVTTSFALAGYTGTAVTADNVGSFTFRGALNEGATYAKGDLKVEGTYTLTGMGTKKYTNEVKPLLQGAGAYAHPITGYGFKVSGTGLSDVQNTPYAHNGGAIAGHANFTYAGTALNGGVDIEFEFNGTKVESIFIDYNGSVDEITETFDIDEDAGTITLKESAWKDLADANAKFKWFIGLDNGEIFGLSVTATAS